MGKAFAFPFACIAIVAQSAASAVAACPADISGLAGGQVYFYDSGTPRPFALASLPVDRPKTMSLFYIVRATADRNGVIIIKSARTGPPTNDRADRVRLVRRGGANECGRTPSGYRGRVARAEYRDYHDLGKDEVGEAALDRLKQFHTAYQLSTDPKSCRATDAKVGPDGFHERWNNRSQFSFDKYVVDNGHDTAIYQIAAGVVSSGLSWFIPPALAASDRLNNQYVEIKRYSTSNRVACIPFTRTIGGTGQILRVNDIEGRRARVLEYRSGELN